MVWIACISETRFEFGLIENWWPGRQSDLFRMSDFTSSCSDSCPKFADREESISGKVVNLRGNSKCQVSVDQSLWHLTHRWNIIFRQNWINQGAIPLFIFELVLEWLSITYWCILWNDSSNIEAFRKSSPIRIGLVCRYLHLHLHLYLDLYLRLGYTLTPSWAAFVCSNLQIVHRCVSRVVSSSYNFLCHFRYDW
jgi:hypothetical protein